ncbi:MAG: FecR domain-containing protein [Tannerellaceae bacterium]|jgi:ferric-dicitrate binding protein FerR (iron transport regulator)|nr:FecR domain-containing protein [Tannerellaceae bacterium]
MKTEKLYRFFEGTASPAEEDEIRRWLASDPQNEQILKRERRLFDMLMLLPDSMAPGLAATAKERKRRFWMREALKVAAVAALVLCAVYAWRTAMPADGSQQAMQTIAVPAGQRVQLTLPDGSKVWLNARTQISYPLNFGRANRVMNMEGEAYFEVTADDRRPFIVKTPGGQVRAVGTKFNVEYYPADQVFRTTLMSGRLLVASSDNPEEELVLTPDRMLSLEGGRFREEAVDDYTRYRWIEGLICFKEASFTDVMKEFEKYYGVSIRVRKESLRQYMFTGKFRHTDGIDYALRVLQRDVKFSYVRDDEMQIFYIE